MNVVGQEVIHKLKLLTEEYSCPYEVVLVDDTAVLMTKQGLVAFKIGSHKVAIWCNIIPTYIDKSLWPSGRCSLMQP